MKPLLFILAFVTISLDAPAATFHLGNFPGSSHFGNADDNSGAIAPFNSLPSSGQFDDTWVFTVAPDNKRGASNVTVTGISDIGIRNLSVQLVPNSTGYRGYGTPFNTLFENKTNILQGLDFGKLAAGAYSLSIWGDVNPNETYHSYSGNLLIEGEQVPSSVPVPGAVWLFGSALLALSKLSKRKSVITGVLLSTAVISSANATTLYSDCPNGGCTVYQSYGSATLIPSKPISQPAVISNCGVSTTTYYVQVPASYYIDELGTHVVIPRVKHESGELSDNKILLGDGYWKIERLNGVDYK